MLHNSKFCTLGCHMLSDSSTKFSQLATLLPLTFSKVSLTGTVFRCETLKSSAASQMIFMR